MIKYIFLFIISLAVFVFYKTPANVLHNQLKNFQLSGKVVDGSAYNANIGLIKFTLNPWKIFSGKLAYDVKLTQGDNHLKTIVGIDVFADIKISDTSGVIDTNYIKKLMKNTPKMMDMAQATFAIKSLEAAISDTQRFIPYGLNATIEAKKVNIVGEKIGSYIANIIIKDTNKFATIKNSKNAIFNLDSKVNLKNKQLVISGNISGKTDDAKGLLKDFGIKNKLNKKINLN